MNELIREIEDDIRRERFEQLWQNLGKIMVAISIAVVLATVVVVMVQNHKQARAMEQTGQFIKGLDRFNAGDYKSAIADFSQLAEDDSSPYYGMAMLRKAQAQNASGDKDGAAKTYKALAAHDKVFGELAAMRDADMVAVPDKHSPQKSPFYFTLSEWKGWQLMHAGKKDEAVAQFFALRDDDEAPYSMRQRMQDVLLQLAPGKTMNDDTMNDKSIKKDEQKK